MPLIANDFKIGTLVTFEKPTQYCGIVVAKDSESFKIFWFKTCSNNTWFAIYSKSQEDYFNNPGQYFKLVEE